MKYIFKPRSNLERFGFFIYEMLVENFPQTYFVGGMARDLLLGRKITDIDIATAARPEEITNLLKQRGIKYSDAGAKFGNIAAWPGKYNIEITTLRKDSYGVGRYPKTTFISNIKADSQRRDFTINALYLSPKQQFIYDFHRGLEDLKNRKIKFIGNPVKRIKEDPLRIARALRFALTLNFKLETKTKFSIKNNLILLDTLTKKRTAKEFDRLPNKKLASKLNLLLNNRDFLDKIL